LLQFEIPEGDGLLCDDDYEQKGNVELNGILKQEEMLRKQRSTVH